MPLVQSLDILRGRMTNPLFKGVLDEIHEKVRAGTSLSDAFAAHADLFPGRLHRVADGGREERQPRDGAAALRGLREGDRRGQAADGLGADLPGRAARAVAGRGGDHRRPGRARVLGLLRAVRPRTAADHARHRRRSRTCVRSQGLVILLVVAAARRGRQRLAAAARASGSGSTAGCWRCPGLAQPRGSSPRLNWRGRSRRCSAAASRS